MPETKAEIFSFLSSRAVKGIGAKRQRRSFRASARQASMFWKMSRNG